MRTVIRRWTASWLTLALLSGAWLPFGAASPVADPDGICGPVFALEHSVQHFETARPPQTSGHCVLCHWLSTLASASASAMVAVVHPDHLGDSVVGRARDFHGVVVIGHTPPRGPPTVS